MSPLKISSEERAGEEWKISDLIEHKPLKQPEGYISYNNCLGGTSIRFTNYKLKSLEAESTRNSITECMEKVDIETEIKHYERLLKNIDNEYSNSAISDRAKKEKNKYIL